MRGQRSRKASAERSGSSANVASQPSIDFGTIPLLLYFRRSHAVLDRPAVERLQHIADRFDRPCPVGVRGCESEDGADLAFADLEPVRTGEKLARLLAPVEQRSFVYSAIVGFTGKLVSGGEQSVAVFGDLAGRLTRLGRISRGRLVQSRDDLDEEGGVVCQGSVPGRREGFESQRSEVTPLKLSRR